MSTGIIKLRGIAWDHSRAFPPLVAAAQRYEETHPGVRVEWRKRTLDEFGHAPIDELATAFDLIVIDHPWAGFALGRGLIHDLRPLIDAKVLRDLADRSIGPCYESYLYEGKLMALPIDAATPAPSWRPDLLERMGVAPPTTWSELLALAELGVVAMPGFDADVFLNFLMICHALGGSPCNGPDQLVEHAIAEQAVVMMHTIASHMPAEAFGWNPIQLAEAMTVRDDIAYCPFAYTYQNYSRPGFSRHTLRYGELITLDDGTPLRSILGGTGIAISTSCNHVPAAVEFAAYLASGAVQAGVYLSAGGQPSHCDAWDSQAADRVVGGFFSGCRGTQEQALLRPRYDGYVPFQKTAGEVLRRWLREGGDLAFTFQEVDALYRQSLTPPRA